MAQTIQQQCSGLPDAWDPFVQLINTVRTLLHITEVVQFHARELVPPALLSSSLTAAVPLLLQLQSCVPLLPAAGTSAGASSSGSISPLEAFVKAQSAQVTFITHVGMLYDRQMLDAAAAAKVKQLMLDPAVQQLLLQPMVAWVAMLHQNHHSEQQKQRQQQSGRLSKQQLHQADLLPIPAFHQDMLQLLPGGQAYLDAMISSGEHSSRQSAQKGSRRYLTYACVTALNVVMLHLLHCAGRDRVSDGRQWLNRDTPLLSAAAVRLVLELQLLAAGEVQRQRRQQQPWQKQQRQTVAVLFNCNSLLTAQLKALAQTEHSSSSSCLLPEVLQQAGLQLLQALAAPLQQLQLGRASGSPCSEMLGDIAFKQLYALRTAASGFNIVHIGGEQRSKPDMQMQ
jgi:hypothetical protein